MNKYKVRMNCISFRDVVVEARNKKEAREAAEKTRPICNDAGFEFEGFLPVEEGDEIEN